MGDFKNPIVTLSGESLITVRTINYIKETLIINFRCTNVNINVTDLDSSPRIYIEADLTGSETELANIKEVL